MFTEDLAFARSAYVAVCTTLYYQPTCEATKVSQIVAGIKADNLALNKVLVAISFQIRNTQLTFLRFKSQQDSSTFDLEKISSSQTR
jgi:hypothetical protein